MALCFDSLLLLTGQASTHNRHPVQSSGETCKVYRKLSNSRHRGFADLNAGGALESNEES